MKPAPLKDVDYIDAATELRLKSIQKKGSDGYSSEGVTQVLDQQGRILCSIPIFMGRHLARLSPDGRILVLSGDFYLGSQFQLSDKGTMATVFDQGKSVKKILWHDLFAADPEKLAKDKNLRVKGGGWVDLSELVKRMEIDWSRRTLIFTVYDDDSKKIVF